MTALTLGACASTPAAPDEFRVVRKAPLTVPPEYNLRPPALGLRPVRRSFRPKRRPAWPCSASISAQTPAMARRCSSRAAGGDAVDRTVRAQVDFDNAQTLRKNRGFADMILNFGGDGRASR